MQLIRKKREPSCITEECLNEYKTDPKVKIIGFIVLKTIIIVGTNIGLFLTSYNLTCPIPNFSEMQLPAFLHRGRINALNELELGEIRERRNVKGNGNF